MIQKNKKKGNNFRERHGEKYKTGWIQEPSEIHVESKLVPLEASKTAEATGMRRWKKLCMHELLPWFLTRAKCPLGSILRWVEDVLRV